MNATTSNQLSENYLFIVSWLLFFACYFIIRLLFGELTCDDAFITLCHSRNWLIHGVPLMSPYNSVCSTSTPLFTIIQTLAGLLNCDSIKFVFVINIIFETATFIMLFKLGQLLSFPRILSLLYAFIYGMSILTIQVGSSGMETPLYILISISGIYLICKNPVPMGLVCACIVLIILIRPEGILWACSWLGILYFRKVAFSKLVTMGVTAGIAFVCFFLFYYFTYGNIFPHSVIAKLNSHPLSLIHSLQFWFSRIAGAGPVLGGKRTRYLISAVALLFAMWGLTQKRKTFKPIIPFILPALIYFGFMIIHGRSNFYFPWYYLPILPWIYLVIAVGFSTFSFWEKRKNLTYMILFGNLLFATFGVFKEALPEKSKISLAAREGCYKQISEYIKSNHTNSGAILIEEVGAIGWYYNGPILDPTGLVSPEVLDLKKEDLHDDYGHYDNLASIFRPVWIVTGNPQGSKQNRFKWIAENYRLEKTFFRPDHYSDVYLLKLIE